MHKVFHSISKKMQNDFSKYIVLEMIYRKWHGFTRSFEPIINIHSINGVFESIAIATVWTWKILFVHRENNIGSKQYKYMSSGSKHIICCWHSRWIELYDVEYV